MVESNQHKLLHSQIFIDCKAMVQYGVEVANQQMQLAASLMNVVREINPEAPAGEVREKLAGLLAELTPSVDASSSESDASGGAK